MGQVMDQGRKKFSVRIITSLRRKKSSSPFLSAAYNFRGIPTVSLSPLESVLTPNPPVTPLESVFTKNDRGWGQLVAWPKDDRGQKLKLTHSKVSIFPCFLRSPRMCYSLDGFRPCSRSTAHGMGYPSTRRDRPELRNQLVRQRRTVIRQPNLLSGGRFLLAISGARKRAPFVFVPPFFSNISLIDRSDFNAR